MYETAATQNPVLAQTKSKAAPANDRNAVQKRERNHAARSERSSRVRRTTQEAVIAVYIHRRNGFSVLQSQSIVQLYAPSRHGL